MKQQSVVSTNGASIPEKFTPSFTYTWDRYGTVCFSIKALFCFSQEDEERAVQLAQEAKSSVNIRELFSGSAAKEYRKELERQERERWEKQHRDSKQLNRYI